MAQSNYLYEYRDESLEKKTMSELIGMTEKLFDERDAYNIGKNAFDRQKSRGDSEITKFFLIFNKIKLAVEENRFTDGFEYALQLKLHLNQYSLFNILVGDLDIANLFCAMTKIITSRFFDTLEKIENKLKLEGEFSTTKMLD